MREFCTADECRYLLQCGPTDKANPPWQSVFSCRQCFFSAHADLNAARVLSGRGACKPPERAAQVASGDFHLAAQSYRLPAGELFTWRHSTRLRFDAVILAGEGGFSYGDC